MLTQSERDQLYGKLLTIFTDHDIVYSEYYRNDLAKLSKDHQSLVEENMALVRVVKSVREFADAWRSAVAEIYKDKLSVLVDTLDTLNKFYETHPVE